MRLKLILALLVLLAIPALAHAQGVPGTLVQQSPTELKACNELTTASGTGAQTATVTPPSGLYVYICAIELSAVANATVTAATPTGWTTTNLNGAVFGFCAQNALTVGQMACDYIYPFTSTPLKSASPGVAVTIVSTNPATITMRTTIYGYFAP